jgi:hypothetical protein
MATQGKKPARPSYTSPKGIFRYPYLVTPDFGSKEYPIPEGEFKVQLILSEADAQPMIDLLDDAFKEAVREGEEKFAKLDIKSRKKFGELKTNDLYDIEYDQETEEPTGNLIFKFATKASGVNAKKQKWERAIPLFDAKGKSVKLKGIGGGTVGKIGFEAAPYFIAGSGTAGLKLYLTGVQVIELRQGGSNRSADSFGFGQEDGFDASEIEDENDSGFGDESTGKGSDDEEDNPDF